MCCLWQCTKSGFVSHRCKIELSRTSPEYEKFHGVCSCCSCSLSLGCSASRRCRSAYKMSVHWVSSAIGEKFQIRPWHAVPSHCHFLPDPLLPAAEKAVDAIWMKMNLAIYLLPGL